MQIIIFISVFVVIAVAVLLLGFLLPVRRAKRLEKLAPDLNFTFSALATPFEDTDVLGLAILENGSSTVVNNLLERASGDCRFLICDIENFPLADVNRTLATTVAAFKVGQVHLPVFQVGEKNTFERVVEQIEHTFGKKLDEFDDDHEFTRNFFVHCAAKSEVRDFLTPAKLTYLRKHAAHFHVDGSPDWLFIYRPGVRVEAEHLKEFSEITSAMASVLFSTQLPKAA